MTDSSYAYDEIIKKMTNQVINEIQKQIENQMIDIGEHQVDINPIIQKQQQKKKHSKKTGRKTSLATLDQLRQMKQNKIIELKEIEKQEDELKKSTVLNQSKITNSSNKLMRSNFTEEQMHEIKKIVKNQKKFQKELKKKQGDLQKWLHIKRIQEQQSRKQYLAQQCQQRKKQLKKQREEQEKRKMQQKIQLQQQIKKLQEIKKKKLLHDQLSESWQKYEQASQAQKQKIWLQQKQRRKFNSKEIKEHEQKYISLIKDQQKKREKTLAQSRSAKHHLPYIHSSIFYKVQKEQEEKARIQQVKIHEKEENVMKKNIYSKKVKELFLPRVKSINSSKEKSQQKITHCNRTLNVEDKYKLGNEYMKLAHEKVTSDQIEKLKNSLITVEQPGGYSSHYKNYLKDLKAESHKENKNKTFNIVQSTLKDKHLSSTDKLHKVKMIFQKDRPGKQSDRQLIDTIKNKMKVLQEFIR